MKKIIATLAFSILSTISFAQQNKSVEIENKIQETIQNNTFLPESKNGTLLKDDGTQISYNTSFYYFLDSEKLFSVLYEEHDEISLNKTYYFDNDELVLVVIEQVNNKASKDRVIEQIFYFFDQGQLIDTSDMTTKYVPTKLYEEGMTFLKDFN
nr:hypothetical protein [uncultured Flavobacterium sp.]